MEQKHFMDIERIKFEDELTRDNTKGFEVGDIIQITEKIDGANASIRYDETTGKLVAFSRKKVLDPSNTLEGFYNYVQILDADSFKLTPNYVIFGEWLVPHTVKYNAEAYKKWYVYDIYDVDKEAWAPQYVVKQFALDHNLIYVHELYSGEFISWNHVKSFCNSPYYGSSQEGVVVKNQTKLNLKSKYNFVLKLVNDSFLETKRDRKPKEIDPQKLVDKENVQKIVEQVVTEARVRKELFKMRDEGILPNTLTPQDMSLVAKTLPHRIYEDCIKEEKELVESAGSLFGRLANAETMKIAKRIILNEGKE